MADPNLAQPPVDPPSRVRNVAQVITMERIEGLTDPVLLVKPFVFQTSPLEELTRRAGHSYGDYETLRRGQFSRPGARQLRTLQFQTLVCDYNPSWAVLVGGTEADPDDWGGSLVRDPQQAAEEILAIAEAGTPFRLRIGNPDLWNHDDVDMPATLRDVGVTERGGEPDARYFDLSFTEHRPQALGQKGEGGATGTARAAHSFPVTVTIDKHGVAVEPNGHRIGDKNHHVTLRKLAKHFYKKQGQWRRIARANGVRDFPGDRDLLQLKKHGRKVKKLTVPEPPRKAGKPTTTGGVSAPS